MKTKWAKNGSKRVEMAQKETTMGLFSRKKQSALTSTGFHDFLNSSNRYSWVSDYITNRNEVDENLAFEHINSEEPYEIASFTMPKFKKLVAHLFAQYLDVEVDLHDDDVKLLQQINRMPLNITVRRIKAKASGNNWSVQYLKGTVYYGKTLLEALKKLQDRNPKIAAKFAGPEA